MLQMLLNTMLYLHFFLWFEEILTVVLSFLRLHLPRLYNETIRCNDEICILSNKYEIKPGAKTFVFNGRFSLLHFLTLQ